MIELINDKYDGVEAVYTSLPDDCVALKNELQKLIETLNNKQLLWIKVPIEKSVWIPILTSLNFEFHHCNESDLMLVKKLSANAFVPTTKNYIVGVGVVVLSEGKLLVIKDRFSIGYKLPGGHIDRNESIKNAVRREVFEETGIDVEFESIMNIGHFANGQFGEANLYIVCTAIALSSKIDIHDSAEIEQAKWIEPADFLQSEDVNHYNKSVVKAAINNKELKLVDQPIQLRVPGEVFF